MNAVQSKPLLWPLWLWIVFLALPCPILLNGAGFAYADAVYGEKDPFLFPMMGTLIGLVLAVMGTIYLITLSFVLPRKTLFRVLGTITLIEAGVYNAIVLTVAIADHY